MGGHDAVIDQARAAFDAGRWPEARAGFLEARGSGPLSAEDENRLAEAAWWEGDVEVAMSGSEEAYRLFLEGDDPDRRQAAMLAIDIGFLWYLRGDEALGSGWMSRAHRLLADEPPGVEHAYLRSVEIDDALGRSDHLAAIAVADEVVAAGEAHGDETLVATALVGKAIATIKSGDVGRGMAILDEAMLPVVAGRVRPTFAGNIYCQLMSICHELADLRRAQQWTDATARWCEGFSSAVMFMGVCRVHRAQLLGVRGEWDAAEAEIGRVRDELESMNVVAVGLALYELGEIRRQRGDLSGAEAAYTEAHAFGRDPLPGLALLWAATGRAEEAIGALRSGAEATADPLARCRFWEALVEAALVDGDVTVAEAAADRLDAAAATYASSGLVAAAATARGRVLLARGDRGAADVLARAKACWHELGARYRVAVVRRLLADAHELDGNPSAAALERTAAAELLRDLGRDDTDTASAAVPPKGLTQREVEVLVEVARGHPNREVADRLGIAEKTVARHLSNIFVKLDVSSRTAAAAFAHQHGLVR